MEFKFFVKMDQNRPPSLRLLWVEQQYCFLITGRCHLSHLFTKSHHQRAFVPGGGWCPTFRQVRRWTLAEFYIIIYTRSHRPNATAIRLVRGIVSCKACVKIHAQRPLQTGPKVAQLITSSEITVILPCCLFQHLPSSC